MSYIYIYMFIYTHMINHSKCIHIKDAAKTYNRKTHDPTRLIETANTPILGIDVHGNVTEWNSKASALTGFTKAEDI